MIIFKEFLDLEDVVDEAILALDMAADYLLPPFPNQWQTHLIAPQQVPPPQGHAQAPLPNLLYNSKSEPDNDDEMDQDLPWRNLQDIPPFQLMNIMRNTLQQPDTIENRSYISSQRTTFPPNNSNTNASNVLHGDWISCVPPSGLDIQYP